MRKKKQKETSLDDSAVSLPVGEVNVKFLCPAFRHKGVEYKSADVERSAAEGDQAAQLLIAELVAKRSGIVEISEVEKEDPKDPTKEGGENE